MRELIRSLAVAALCVWLTAPRPAGAQDTDAIPRSITTPDKVETRIGTLDFTDGAPSMETAEKIRDALDFTRAIDAYNNSFRGASAYALGNGFQSIGAEDDAVIIFSISWTPSRCFSRPMPTPSTTWRS